MSATVHCIAESYAGPFPFAGLSKRQRQIVDRVRDQGFVTIETLAEEFDTSAQTVRRDIIRLSEIGVLQRFHGGAGLADASVKPARSARVDNTAAERQRVAEIVARQIAPGSSVFLDAGATAQAVAIALRNHQGLRVVTCNLLAALSLGGVPAIAVQVTGGELRGEDNALVGYQAITMLQDVRVDVAVIGCSGFDLDGAPMGFDGEKIAVKRAAMRRASRSILAADASKFERTAMMRIAAPETFAMLVTSAPPGAAMAEAMAAAPLAVVVE